MAKKYIKSYSNYVLKTKHQQTSNGTIFERDITTIGGRDQFAKGQVPIYRTGNFVITTNNIISNYKKVSSNDWQRNDEGEVWTLNTLKHYEKDEKTSYDEKIVIKKDYFDLRDYAYYGSCSELIRVSINDILKNYPGELFVPFENLYVAHEKDEYGKERVQYTEEAAIDAFGINGYDVVITGLKGYYTSMETRPTREVDNCKVGPDFRLNPSSIDGCHPENINVVAENADSKVTINTISLIDPLTDEELEELKLGTPYTREFKYITDKYGNVLEEKDLSLIDNPFEINIHDKFIPDDKNPLRYFANGGINNYVAYLKDDDTDEWIIDDNHEYLITIEDILFDGLGESESETIFFDVIPNELSNYCKNTVELTAYKAKQKISDCFFDCIEPGKYIGKITLCLRKTDYTFKTTPGLQRDGKVPMVLCCDGALEFNGDGDEVTGVCSSDKCVTDDTYIESFKALDCNYDNIKPVIYMFMGDDNEIKYLVENKPENYRYRIRPNTDIIEKYFHDLDLFEKVLLNRDTEPIYTANFELINENDFGMYTYTKQFTFPTTYGGYNLGSNNMMFNEYVSSLSEVGEYYDNLFTDNLWRSMTHEAIKNFDWTYTRHYTKGEEEPFVEGGTKIQKVIRLYGREFDEVKSYIDAIDDLNTITYDNVSNIPDYFLTDKLEEEGWDVKLIYPLELSEFINGYDNVPIDIHNLFPNKYDENGEEIDTKDAEKLNFFYDSYDKEIRNKITIQRVFNQTSKTVNPYNSKDVPNSEKKCGSTVIRVYDDNKTYSPSDVSTEFVKRLYLNSSEIWRHKGTIEGIEMLLGMFGLKSKNKVYTDERYFSQHINEKDCLTLTDDGKEYYKNYLKQEDNEDSKNELYNLYDYDIKEYTLFTTREEDEWLEDKNMYKYDWINYTKLMPYINKNNYQPYQGLPVVYRNDEDDKNVRYLYPNFNTYESYDGNPYYQMNGGWLQKKPFMFDNNNNIVLEDFESDNRKNRALFTETIRNIKCVDTIQELLLSPSLANGNGDICEVTDISGRYAIIDGYVYPLLTEENDNVDEEEGNTFFYASVVNNSLSVGNVLFTDYVVISNPYFPNGKQKIDLTDDYYSDREIKIYVIKNKNEETDKYTYDVDIHSNELSISTFTVFENGHYMEGDNYTNYFRINNIDYYNELSVLGWQQLRDDEYEYYKLNTITDYMGGNNPHTGHMSYDNGHEYLTYLHRLFKHISDNDLIDYRQYSENDIQYLEDLNSFGFKNLIEEDECEKDYTKFLREDNKCHFFGEILSIAEDNTCEDARLNVSCFKKRNSPSIDEDTCPLKITDVIRKNIINDSEGLPIIEPLKYGEEIEGDERDKIDKYSNQIVNTKRMEIEFFIHNKYEYSKEWLEEIKYIDSVILPYLTQVIPSNVIWGVKYTTNDSTEWKYEDPGCVKTKFETEEKIIPCDRTKETYTINLTAVKE